MAGKSVGAAGHFGRQMRKERLAHGWTLREFADKTGIAVYKFDVSDHAAVTAAVAQIEKAVEANPDTR